MLTGARVTPAPPYQRKEIKTLNILGRKDTAKDFEAMVELTSLMTPLVHKLKSCSPAVVVATICATIDTTAGLTGLDKLDLLTEVNTTILNHMTERGVYD